MKVDPEPPPDSTDIANLTSYLRQIADELDYEAKCPPCSEAEIIRLAATEIERLRRDVAEMGVLVTRAIDNFLIDRVFQRISDALARWVSCYGIAEFLFTGAILLMFVSVVTAKHGMHFGRERWLFLWVMGLIKRISMDRAACSNVLPTERISGANGRFIYMVFCTSFLVTMVFLLQESTYWLNYVGWLLATFASYFMACWKLPPKLRRSHVPAHAVLAEK
jgi:hypothetical protein